MFDTVSLYQPGRNKENFLLNPNIVWKTSGSATNDRNDISAYYRTFYNEDGKRSINIRYDVNNSYLTIIFSIPKLIYGNNINEFSVNDSDVLVSELKKRIDGILEVDTANLTCNELHVSKNINVDCETGSYIMSLLKVLNASKRYRVDKYTDESLTVHNKSIRFVIYDKIKEAISSKDIKSWEGKELGNILRIENQITHSKNVRKITGNDIYFDDLLKEETHREAKIHLINTFDKFYCDPGQLTIFENDISVIKTVMRKSKRDLLNKFILKKAIEDGSIKLDYGYYEILLQEVGFTRQGIKKSLENLREFESLSRETATKLVDEVRTKLVA